MANAEDGVRCLLVSVRAYEAEGWKAFGPTLNADIPRDFLRRLVKDVGRKIYLILDNLRVHFSSVQRQPERIKSYLQHAPVR